MPNTVPATGQTPSTREGGDTVVSRSWTDREAAAETMVPLIGRLFRSHGVITSVYGRSLVNQPVKTILKIHRFARQVDGTELPTEDTLALLHTLSQLDLAPAHIDLGELNRTYRESAALTSLEEFLRAELTPVVGSHPGPGRQRTDVVLYGFGRIGRLLARLMIENAGAEFGLNLRAVVVRKGPNNDLANAPACCAATPSTDLSTAASPSTPRPTPSSPTATPSRSSTPTTPPRSTTPPMASTTPSWSTTPDAGATGPASPST